MSESHQYQLPHALSIPELLSIIFGYATSKIDLLSYACVCRSWLDPALDILWTKVDYAAIAFGTLAPLIAPLREDEGDDWPYV